MTTHSLRYRAPILLLIQLIFISSSPFWGSVPEMWLSLAFPALFAISGLVLTESRRWLAIYLTFSVINVAAAQFTGQWFIDLLRFVCSCGVFYLMFSAIIRHSFFKQHVPHGDRILAGVAGYLLLGLFWFLQFEVYSRIQPGALHNQITGARVTEADQLYFSFVTLTSLGYGDIAPFSPFAKVLVMLTSLSGVLYLAVFVASIIGKSPRDRSSLSRRGSEE